MLEGKRHEKNLLQLLNNRPFDGSKTVEQRQLFLFSNLKKNEDKDKTLMDKNQTL